jgi:hypothetical protein
VTASDKPSIPPRHESSWLLAVLLVAPAAIFVAKLPFLPTSAWLTQALSLADLSPRLQVHTEFVLFVPLSAVVVCFFRLTLGLPVLSLFRPILTALAFRIVGIPLGLAFLVAVLGAVVLVKPLLEDAHYYVRVPLVLSLAAAAVLVPLLMDRWWHAQALRHLAYFPVINLALVCESFTKILNQKGLRAAMWPTVNAVLAAIAIALLAAIPGALHVLLAYPEVLLLQAGIVLLIGKHLDLQLFADRNPFMPKPAAAPGSGERPSTTPKLRLVSE